MAVTRAKKSDQLTELKEKFAASRSVTFTQYSGIGVKDLEALRRKLRAVDAELIVAKKTLIALAAKEVSGIEIPDTAMTGPVAAVFSMGDEVAGPQVLAAFAKEQEKIVLTGGILEGSVLGSADINQLANLPSKPQLVGQLLSVMIAPIRGIAVASNEVLAGLARAIDAIAKKASTN